MTVSHKGNHLGICGSVGTCRRAGGCFVPLFYMMNSINSGPCWEMLGRGTLSQPAQQILSMF